MRLFVALDIDPAIRERLSRFRSEMKTLAPGARWVGAETLHITLKFIGEQAPEHVEAIQRALSGIKAQPTTLHFHGTGFFPNPRSARVFWVGVDADEHMAELAKQVDQALAPLRIRSEDKPYTPHLTLARGGDPRHPRGGSGRPTARLGDRPNAVFAALQEQLSTKSAPEFGTMHATEFFLYESKLSPGGAHYTKLARFPLG